MRLVTVIGAVTPTEVDGEISDCDRCSDTYGGRW